MKLPNLTSSLIGVMIFCAPAWGQEVPQNSADYPACDELGPYSDAGVCMGESGQVAIRLVHERLSPVVTYGDRPQPNPGAISEIGAGDIQAMRADHPAELLNTVPGVKVEENSGQESLIAIRSPVLNGGAGQGSFLILTQGVPNRASAFGNVNMLMESHFEVADVVEVVRGPGSAKYGSNAAHGLVNVILPTGGGGDSFVTASGSTLSRYRVDGLLEQPDGAFGISVQRDQGWRQSSGVDQVKLSATRQWGMGEWSADGFVVATWLDQETAGFIQGPRVYKDEDTARSNPNPDAYREAVWGMAAVRLERNIGDVELRLTPYVRGQAMEFSQHFLPYDGTEENGHWSAGLMGRIDGSVGDTEWRVGADFDYASGYLTEVQDRPSFGAFPQGTHYDYTVDTLVGALWGEVELQLSDDWRVQAGLRGEAHRYEYETDVPPGVSGRFLVVPDRTDDFAFLTPKLGVVRDFGDVEVYANYARGARAPQASDLYRLQSSQVEPAADVETLDSIEVGVRGTAYGRVSYDVAAYAMKKRGFFFRDADGLNVSNGKTEHYGIEAAFSWWITDALSVSGSASWSDQTYAFDRIVAREGESIRDGARIDTAPELLADLAISYDPEGPWRWRLSAEHVGEYFTDAENTARYPGHTIVNFRAGYDATERIEVFLIVRNLTDAAYASRADFAFGNDRYFPGEPLNATFGITRRF